MEERKGAGVEDREKVSNDRESKSVADDAGKYYIIHYINFKIHRPPLHNINSFAKTTLNPFGGIS